MREILLALLIFTPFAASAQEAPTAQAAYVERRALLAADQSCALFTPPIRTALQATAAQARGALLRGGWTLTRLDELDAAAVGAVRGRPCNDPTTQQAAARARLGFQSWSRSHAMTFPGGARAWYARRTPDPVDHWMLKQPLSAGAVFGVREPNGVGELAVTMPLSDSAPGAAELVMRDVARAPRSQMDVPGRLARGLAAGAPAPATATAFRASARRIETGPDGVRRVVFVFPGAALMALCALDPREAAEIRFDGAAAPILIEIGDIAAARAFLVAQS